MMSVEAQIAYYVNLIVIQYKNLPNAQGTISALATQVVADQIYQQVMQGFSVAGAIGQQLTWVGEYVGAPRTIAEYNPSIPQFELTPYADTPGSNVGFGTYSSATPPPDIWLSYFTSGTSFTLSDGQLRQLIQYLIALHMDPHTVNSIDVLLQTYFGDYVLLTDNQNMSIKYTHLSTDPGQLFGIVNELGLLPHPAGVAVTVVTS